MWLKWQLLALTLRPLQFLSASQTLLSWLHSTLLTNWRGNATLFDHVQSLVVYWYTQTENRCHSQIYNVTRHILSVIWGVFLYTIIKMVFVFNAEVLNNQKLIGYNRLFPMYACHVFNFDIWQGKNQPLSLLMFADLISAFIFEPSYDKTNKMTVRPAKTQISLGIRPVWSEPSLCAQWVAKRSVLLQTDSEDSGRMARLICLRWAHMPVCWFCNEARHWSSGIIGSNSLSERVVSLNIGLSGMVDWNSSHANHSYLKKPPFSDFQNNDLVTSYLQIFLLPVYNSLECRHLQIVCKRMALKG